ncbi:MAG: hypothetical protein ACK5KR_05775 [Breznakia sp.]
MKKKIMILALFAFSFYSVFPVSADEIYQNITILKNNTPMVNARSKSEITPYFVETWRLIVSFMTFISPFRF